MGKIKRFSWRNFGEVDAIADNGTFRWHLCTCEDMDKLVEFMNELASENKKLKKENKLIRDKLESFKEISRELLNNQESDKFLLKLTYLMEDYNLNWQGAYNIVKKGIKEGILDECDG